MVELLLPEQEVGAEIWQAGARCAPQRALGVIHDEIASLDEGDGPGLRSIGVAHCEGLSACRRVGERGWLFPNEHDGFANLMLQALIRTSGATGQEGGGRSHYEPAEAWD